MLLTERQIIDEFEKISLPPLVIRVVLMDYRVEVQQNLLKYRPDLIIEVEWEGKTYKFFAEVIRLSTPKEFEGAIQRVRSIEMQPFLSDKYWPMIIAPYIRPEALDRLIAEGISGIDLSGNGVVQVPGELFILRKGASNRFPTSAPIKNVFSGTSSLISRVFFSRQTFSSVNEVLKEITKRGGKITLPTVSKALKTLQDELLVGREENIKLLNAKKLLELLSSNYRGPNTRRRLLGKIASAGPFFSQLLANAEMAKISVVGSNPALYAVMPTEAPTAIYTSSIEKLLRDLKFTETNRFANVEFLETDDQTVYFDSRCKDSFLWTPPLQVYLELARGGKRERETAEQIRDQLLQIQSDLSAKVSETLR